MQKSNKLTSEQEKALYVFPASVFLNITNQSCHQFSVIFFKMCTFSYGHLFLVSIFYQLTSENNQVHTGDLTTDEILYDQKHEGQQRKLASTIQVSFLKYSVIISSTVPQGKVYSFPHFIVFCSSVCFPNNLNDCCQQMQGAHKMCTVINTLIPESDQYLISPFNIIPKSSIKAVKIKEMN